MNTVMRSDSLAALAMAKARAQAKFLPLGKGKSATVALKSGGSYSYEYADLAACLESVIPALSESGIAVFQPTRIEDGSAIATTLLVHGESGEWIASEYAAIAIDPRDARSVGSAATYARRYGLLAMLAIASSDEDDDGEEARGGAHEMPQTRTTDTPRCPVCGKDAIIKGKAEWGGGWVCFKKKGGCGKKWPEGPFPTGAEHDAFEVQKSGAGERLFETPGEQNVRGDLLGLVKGVADHLRLTPQERAAIWAQHCGKGKPETVDIAALEGLFQALKALAEQRAAT